MLGIGFGHTTARWLSERNLLLEPGAAIAPPAAAMPSARCVRHPDGVPWLPTGSIGLTGHGCQVRTPSLFSLWDKFRFPTRAHSSALRCPWSRLVARGIEQYPPLPTHNTSRWPRRKPPKAPPLSRDENTRHLPGSGVCGWYGDSGIPGEEGVSKRRLVDRTPRLSIKPSMRRQRQ